MELHAYMGQNIHSFAEVLYQVSKITDVVGVFNELRIPAQEQDKGPDDIVKRYYAMVEER
jgi:hypothetical protein